MEADAGKQMVKFHPVLLPQSGMTLSKTSTQDSSKNVPILPNMISPYSVVTIFSVSIVFQYLNFSSENGNSNSFDDT
ncbi:MAG: hypothetical protein ABSA46_02460 [Thermodesulfovibrionales bacterium]|jgi:hypothetical protein